MKLAKLSLAAILAAGAFSVANASSLEDSIKGVTLNGMLRIRFYNRTFDHKGVDKTVYKLNPTTGVIEATTVKGHPEAYNRWRTNGVFIFGVPVGENLSIVYRSSVQTDIHTNGNNLSYAQGGTIDNTIANNLLFMKYSNGPANVILGKIPVATPITSIDPATPSHGAGLLGTYNVGNGLTLAGAFVDAINIGPGEALGGIGQYLGNDLGALAVMYKNDMVNVAAWYYRITNAYDSIFTVQATVKPMAGLSIHGDYSYFNAVDDLYSGDSKKFYNINVGYAANGFSGKVGYANSSDDQGVASLAADSTIAAVLPTANRYVIADMRDTDAWYGKVGYNVNAKTNVYAAYTSIDQGNVAGNNDSDEYMAGVKYQYNKKLGFHAYYDVLDYDNDVANNDENEFRFEARYNF